MSRCIVIGDVHGCIEELKELLDLVKYNHKNNDRLILLGDLIDRGPDPAGVVALARQLGAECVMGNHEKKALRWRRHERHRKEEPKYYKNPMLPINHERLDQWSKIPDEHWSWIATWPTFIHINDECTGVHAGCMPNLDFEEQIPNNLMRLRYIRCISMSDGRTKYKMATLKNTSEKPEAKNDETVVHWTELWTGPRDVIYGHYIWDDVHVTTYKSYEGLVKTFGIDTGCVHGGHLTAMVFENDELTSYQIKANKIYAKRKVWIEED